MIHIMNSESAYSRISPWPKACVGILSWSCICEHTGNGNTWCIFFWAEDCPCFPHHVRDKFVHAHLDGFWHLWINIFAYGKKLAQRCYKQITGHTHLRYSVGRWWSKFDCIEQVAVDWATIMPHVLVQIVQGSSTVNSSAQALLTLLMENKRSKEDIWYDWR